MKHEKVKFTEDFESPKYGQVKTGDELSVSEADAVAFERDGRAARPEKKKAAAKGGK